jgi:hypothetical protein
MEEWFTLNNTLYVIVLALGGLLTILSSKYRKILKELVELAETLKTGLADKKLTKSEKEDVLKEALDVVRAIILLKWKLKA